MAQIDRRVRILRRLRPDERAAALADSLAFAGESEFEPLASLLLDLAAHPQAGEAQLAAAQSFVLNWRRLPAQLRGVALASCRARWTDALAGAEPRELGRAGQSVAEWALDSCHPAAPPLLGEILASGEAQEVAASGQALLALAMRVAGVEDPALLGLPDHSPALRPILDPAVEPWTTADVRALMDVVAGAVAGFDTHRRKELLLAVLVLLEHPRSLGPGAAPVREMIDEADSPAGAALRTAFRRARAPLARQRAWQWLREPLLAAACAERVARAPTIADHALVLTLGHLALAPTRERHLRLVPITTRPAPRDQSPPGVAPAPHRLHPGAAAPDAPTLRSLPAAARRRAPRFVATLAGDSHALALALDPFLADPDPIARLAAASALGPDLVRDFCFDASGAIARHAALSASACGTAESARLRAGDANRRRFAGALARSPHDTVRAIGREEIDRVTSGPGSPGAALAARRAFASDPARFLDEVRDALRGNDPDAAVRVLLTCRRIRAVSQIEPLLLAAVRGSLGTKAATPGRVAATAVACLGDLASARVGGVLAECLAGHPDARVRANAAEAIARRRRAGLRDALPDQSAGDEHHRVRASVLRAMLCPLAEPKPGEPAPALAVTSLASMLLDERPPHRLAGVWVVQRSIFSGVCGRAGRRWGEVASRVRTLALADPDDGVRARAAAVAERLDTARAASAPLPAGSREP